MSIEKEKLAEEVHRLTGLNTKHMSIKQLKQKLEDVKERQELHDMIFKLASRSRKN